MKCFERGVKFNIYQQCLENQIEDINKILSSFYDDNNLIVFMGAGSITHKAHKLIKENNVRKNSRNFKKIK